DADTALQFRRDILRPFLDRYLKDGGGAPSEVAPVNAFETGTNRWLRLTSWPAGCPSGCALKPSPLYLAEGSKATFAAPRAGGASAEYVADPARPVPFRRRPIEPPSYEDNIAWRNWLVTDQREASGRTDVLSFTTDVLTAPVKISGQPAVHLIASTSGTDSDW